MAGGTGAYIGRGHLAAVALVLGAAILSVHAGPAHARDSLGLFGQWGAFRDPDFARCYAIAQPTAAPSRRDYKPYASVGTWPRRKVRGQIHIRLSRQVAKDSPITLALGDRRFTLTGGGGDAWARDGTMDAAIVAAMRSSRQMIVRARDRSGRAFSDRYDLDGVATAMDAATVGCARIR